MTGQQVDNCDRLVSMLVNMHVPVYVATYHLKHGWPHLTMPERNYLFRSFTDFLPRIPRVGPGQISVYRNMNGAEITPESRQFDR